MKLICAKHPLLIAKELNYLKSDGPCIPPVEKAVPIDVYFGDDYKTFVITGANMGGKTVALKTIGLLTVMYQAGIPIPVSPQSDIAIFDSLFAEIGEKQGIESSLSTFTSHIVNIRKIIEEICGVSLVLVDEIGTGTDPNEGAALALAIIEYLKEKNTKVVITTHYNLVKAYALRCSDMTSVFVEFNPKEDKPTYNLIYGLPGNSNGLFVAQKMGISNEVIKKATHFLGERENYLVNLLEQLSMILGDLLHSKDELVKVKDAAYRYQRDLELMVNEVKKKRKDVFVKFENEAERTLNNAERDIKRLIQEMKDTHQSPDLKSIQKSFEDIKEVIFSKSFEDEGSERSEIQNIVKGDRVFITPLGKEGKICEVISHKNMVEVLVGNLKIKVPLSNLKKIDTQGLPCSDSGNKRDFFRICPELLSENEKRSERVSLIGFSVEDAISCMDEVLDKALLNDISELALIHGFGSGRLKDAVRRFLKDHPHVKGYQTAETSKGGDGVTIVEMDV